MADAEKSLLFVIRASIEDFNQKLGQAQKEFKHTFGNIQKELDQTGNRFLAFGGVITGFFVGAIIKASKSSEILKEPLDKIRSQFDLLFKTIAENPAIINLLNQFANLITKAVEWITKHPDLVKAFLAVGIAIATVGAALKAAAIAMAFIQALSGAGLVKVLAGLAVGGAAVLAINQAMETPATETSTIPAAASGGIFTRPTLAMIGEGGPEAAIPLSSLGNMGGIGGGTTELHVHIGNYIGDDTTKRQLIRDLQGVLNEETRRFRFNPSKTEPYGGNHL